MAVRSLVAASLSVGLLTRGSVARAAEPAIVTKWLSTTMPIRECTQQAEKALRANQFTRVDVVGDSKTDKNVFGNRGNYVASINCITEKEIAYFVVSGPDSDTTQKYVDALQDKF